MFEWILAISGVIGAALNSSQKNKLVAAGFIVWTFGNVCWVFFFYSNKQPAQAFMFFIYLLTSLNGIRKTMPAQTEPLEIIIQDDLSGLEGFKAKVEWRPVPNWPLCCGKVMQYIAKEDQFICTECCEYLKIKEIKLG